MKYLKVLAALGVLALAGAGSAVVLESFGTITGTADVKPAIKIVEVDYESQSGTEYVKLYNPSDADVSLGSWKVSDGDSDDEISGLTIPSKSYALLLGEPANTTDRDIPNYDKFNAIGSGLANSGDKVFLEASSELEIDSVVFTDDPCDGKTLSVDWETGDKSCVDTSYDFEGELN